MDGPGWSDWQHDDYFPYRRMGAAADLSARGAGRFLALPVFSLAADGAQILRIEAGGRPLPDIPLFHLWHVYDIELPPLEAAAAGHERELVLHVQTAPAEGPEPAIPVEREVRVGVPDVHDDARRHRRFTLFADGARRKPVIDAGGVTAEIVIGDRLRPSIPGDAYHPQDGEGWHGWEFGEPTPYRWMARRGRLTIPASVHRGRPFVSLPVFSLHEDQSQVLTVSAGDEALSYPLVFMWSQYTVKLPRVGPDEAVELLLSVSKPIPDEYRAAGETRELAIRVGPLWFFSDQRRHDALSFYYDNLVANDRELAEGATVLSSFPVNLGIDLFGKCNIKPACAYCLWDDMKALESDNVDAVVDEATLESYEGFFRGASTLVNCAFGEPLLHTRLAEVLELADSSDKLVELATNGQAFTPDTVAALAGRRVRLSISLDAASPEVYARLRNDRWHEVITGLLFLREARRRVANRLPSVHMVFMPMRANVGDLEAFVKLCRVVEADRLVLRPLNYLENVHIRSERGGYAFDYAKELLTIEELRDVVRRCAALGVRYGIEVGNQFEFGMSASERKDWRGEGASRDGQ